MRALEALQFQSPTPVQEQAIPFGLEGRDVIACAQTGTGKTGAFCIPLAAKLLSGKPTDIALVLTPTRELAVQIEDFWKQLTRFTPDLRSACLIGGLSFSQQTRALKQRPRLIIATPGRLNDHIEQRTIMLAQTHFLVLDEADRMLDMGFAPQLAQIAKFLPASRQTMLFTATWDGSLDKLAQKYLSNPERVSVGSTARASDLIDQKIISTTSQLKNETLMSELRQREGSVLIFTRTQMRTDRLARYLASRGIQCGRIHGGRTQAQRSYALDSFKKGSTQILVATDIAARGIDVSKIAHVINYDLPRAAEDYIHRIGRTGRAGNEGQALSLLTPEENGEWRQISRILKKSGSPVPEIVKYVSTPENAADAVEPPPPRVMRSAGGNRDGGFSENRRDSGNRGGGNFDNRSRGAPRGDRGGDRGGNRDRGGNSNGGEGFQSRSSAGTGAPSGRVIRPSGSGKIIAAPRAAY